MKEKTVEQRKKKHKTKGSKKKRTKQLQFTTQDHCTTVQLNVDDDCFSTID